MSKYIGGYILYDLTDNEMGVGDTIELPKELQDYLKQFLNGNEFSKEVLMKPINLILKDSDNDYTLRFTFNILNDNGFLIGDISRGNKYYYASIYLDTDENYICVELNWGEI